MDVIMVLIGILAATILILVFYVIVHLEFPNIDIYDVFKTLIERRKK